jgi:hypothetical protein
MLFQKPIIEEMRTLKYLGNISDFPNLENRINATANRQAEVLQELFHYFI